MSPRPDIAAALDKGEALLWQSYPQPGRRIPVRATILASAFFAATLLLLLLAWYLAIFQADAAQIRLIVYAVIGTAAFLAFLGLRLTLLDRRRARARDRRTAYGITDRRALVIAGPYSAEVHHAPGVAVTRFDDCITVEGEATRLRFERLDDAGTARDILIAQIEGKT